MGPNAIVRVRNNRIDWVNGRAPRRNAVQMQGICALAKRGLDRFDNGLNGGVFMERSGIDHHGFRCSL